ncbi:hypothetical protein [Saccharopolyspora spinosa]|uniref:Uncharacterized protein n=1 Tax=Saccharopolyspora spinosa TaxID=60894 RepID=A0A2N3Y3C7_SACSN|nr:hypothetical protein [Saccharopolyspora spinosa]PKW17433.1 hypothetical protein A8926_5396 [Saccharopolyspora spinosa]
MPFAKTADQAEIYYQARSSGEPLVLLSGQANTHHWWDNRQRNKQAAQRRWPLTCQERLHACSTRRGPR